ncbi:MAG: PII-like signaling protein [Chlamydiales bacterium]|jgi:PII-like signaling protein
MKGLYLEFYFQEFHKHNGILLYEWLLETAKEMGIQGGSVFRGIAGYGRHGILHEEQFFELASNVPVKAMFMVNADEAEQLLEKVKSEKIHLVYSKVPIEYERLNG